MAKKQRVSVVNWIGTVEYPTLGKKVTADITKYPKEMQEELMRHGWRQKFGDAASGKEPAEKYEMAKRIHAGLMDGQWELTANVDLTPLVLEAVARLKGLKFNPDKLTLSKGDKVLKPNEKDIAGWRTNAQVKAEIATIRAERLQDQAEDSEEIEIDL